MMDRNPDDQPTSYEMPEDCASAIKADESTGMIVDKDRVTCEGSPEGYTTNSPPTPRIPITAIVAAVFRNRPYSQPIVRIIASAKIGRLR